MTAADPGASVASAIFQAWAGVARAMLQANETLLRTLAESTFRERDIDLVGGVEIDLIAPIGAALTSGPFLWEDEDGNPSAGDKAEQVIAAESVSFVPASMPAPKPGSKAAVVRIRLKPDHPVRTGNYVGKVYADGVAVDKPRVFVSGIDR